MSSPRYYQVRRQHYAYDAGRDSSVLEYDPRYDDGSHVYMHYATAFLVVQDFICRWPTEQFERNDATRTWRGRNVVFTIVEVE